MAQALIASLAATLVAFALPAAVFALINGLTYLTYGHDSNTPSQAPSPAPSAIRNSNAEPNRTTYAYPHNGQVFEITWDTAGQRAVIRYPLYPQATGYVLATGTTRQSKPYTGQAYFGDRPEHHRHSPGHSAIEDAVNWVCARLLERYTNRTDPAPADRDAGPKAIRDFVESLSPSSPPERR